MSPTYVSRDPVPLFLLRRKLRAAYKAAEHEFRMAQSYLTHDALRDARTWADAWCCFELSYHNLREAEQEYWDTCLERQG